MSRQLPNQSLEQHTETVACLHVVGCKLKETLPLLRILLKMKSLSIETLHV